MIAKITAVYVRRYADNNTTTAYVEWIDGRGQKGRTEGHLVSQHMQALFRRADREGVAVNTHTW